MQVSFRGGFLDQKYRPDSELPETSSQMGSTYPMLMNRDTSQKLTRALRRNGGRLLPPLGSWSFGHILFCVSVGGVSVAACEDGESQKQTPVMGWAVSCSHVDPDTPFDMLLCKCVPAATCRSRDSHAEQLAALS